MKKNEKYPLETHLTRFNTEKQCQEYLVQVLWNGKLTCPKCGNCHGNYQLKNRKEFICTNNKCNKQFSIVKGTIFEHSKISLTKWFQAIYLYATMKGGVSSHQLSKLLGIRQMTVWFMLKRLRQVSKEENEIVLNGIVQADETFIGPSTDRNRRLQVKRRIHEEEQEMLHGPTDSKRRRKGIKQKAGRKKGSTKEVLAQKKEERGGEEYKTHTPSVRIPFETGAMVLGMMEKGGKVVMKKIGTDKRSVSSRIIFPVLTRHIDQDSILITDQAGAYKGTHEIFKQHLTVVHGTKFVSPDGIHDNDLENAWKHLKKMIRGTYIHTSFHHLDGYLNEFAYRWNKRKQTEKELFEAFIPMVVDKRVTLKELKAKGKE